MNAVEHANGPETLPLDDSLESKILRFLKEKFESRTALQISKGIGLKTAKQVNPSLYALEKRNLVHKIQKNRKIEWLAADCDFEMLPAIVDIDEQATGNEAGYGSGTFEEEAVVISSKAEVFDPGQRTEDMDVVHEHGKRHWQESDDEMLNPKHASRTDSHNQSEDNTMYSTSVQPSSIGTMGAKSTTQIHNAPPSEVGRGYMRIKIEPSSMPVRDNPVQPSSIGSFGTKGITQIHNASSPEVGRGYMQMNIEPSSMPVHNNPVQPSSISSLGTKSITQTDAAHGVRRGNMPQYQQTPASSNQPHNRKALFSKPNQLPKASQLPKAPHELLQTSTQVSEDDSKSADKTGYYKKDQGYENYQQNHYESKSGFDHKTSPRVHGSGYSQDQYRKSYHAPYKSQEGVNSPFQSRLGENEAYPGSTSFRQNRPQPSHDQSQEGFNRPFSSISGNNEANFRRTSSGQTVQPLFNQQASPNLRPSMNISLDGNSNVGNLKGSDEEICDKIVSFLKLFNRPIATLEIAKAINKGRKKEINPILYDMQERGIIYKHTAQPPAWRLCECSSEPNQKAVNSGVHQSYSSSQSQPSLLSHASHGQQSSFHQPQVNQYARQFSWPANAVEEEMYQSSLTGSSSRYINENRSLMQQSHPTPSLYEETRTSNMQATLQSSNPIKSTQNLSTKPPSEISEITFAALNKNPVSALNEYAQKNQIEMSFEVLNEAKGGPNKFLVAVQMNGKMYNAASAANMKEAKRQAADLALRDVLNQQTTAAIESGPNLSKALTHFDRIAMLSHQAFITISAGIQEKFAGRKVIAAIIMKTYNDNIGKVVSIGTGNRCITGDRLNLEGKTVNDSHAEIICRRSFLHFLYSEIEKFYAKNESLFEEGGLNDRLQVKDGVTFHLYISTAPCGDGALFSPRDSANLDPSAAVNAPRDHSPVFTSKQQGLLRTKIEDGEGTIPIDPSDGPQTWDGIVMGKRLRTMSCTDKVCRWNILGLQGALLSHLIDPIYLETITLGYLYDHGHLSRAVCCRLNKHSTVDKDLPMPYFLNHPWLGRVTAYEPPRETEKTNNMSINWHLGCKNIEITDGRAGCCLTRTDNAPTPSRLCKSELFQHFKQICSKVPKLHYLMDFDSYRDAKERAQSFQQAKQIMNRQFTVSKFGTWVKKPRELEIFDVSNH